jgi:hypothetical protein
VSALTVIYGDPDVVATIELVRAHDPHTGLLHEAHVWSCRCGATGQTAVMRDAQDEVKAHRAWCTRSTEEAQQ